MCNSKARQKSLLANPLYFGLQSERIYAQLNSKREMERTRPANIARPATRAIKIDPSLANIGIGNATGKAGGGQIPN